MTEGRGDPIISGPEPSVWSLLWAPLKTFLARRRAGAVALRDAEASDRTNRHRPPSLPADPPEGTSLINLPKAWKALVAGSVIAAVALFHLAPVAAGWLGEPRAELDGLLGFLPFGDTLAAAAAGWLWAPAWLWIAATLLRLHGLYLLRKEPPAGIMAALLATALQAGAWLFAGLDQVGAYSPAEQAALILMLKVEGGVLLGLFFIFAPPGRRRLGQTDADWTR